MCPEPIDFCTHLTQSHPAVPELCPFLPTRWRACCENLTDSATSPDGISPHVLKTCSVALAHAFSVLFTLSFPKGYLPSAWKSANITALHKKGAKADSCNYRLIILLPIISMVMESIIDSDIESFHFSNGFISEHLFGFRRGHSTLVMMLLLSQRWMEVLNAKHDIRAISRDIS